MKKGLLILSFCFLLIHCDSKPVEKPKNLISEDVMVDIFYDLQLLNAMKSSGLLYGQESDFTAANYIYKKYKVDSLQFAQSDLYYASNVEDYEKLYQRTTDRLKENKVIIDSLLAKYPEPIDTEKAKLDEKLKQKKDSLSKIRAKGLNLFKEEVKN